MRVIWQVLREPEIQSKTLHPMKNAIPRMPIQMPNLQRKRRGVLRCLTRQTTLLKGEIVGAADKLETMLRGAHPSVNIFFPAGQPWRAAGAVAAGETNYLVNLHSRQICPFVYDYCSRTVVTRAN